MPRLTSGEKKLAAELAVAGVFCKWYSRTQGVKCVVVRSLKEPAPDVLIRVGKSDVAVELAKYREQGSYNEQYQLDRHLKLALSERFGQFGRNRLPRCSPRLDYRKAVDKPGYYTIPRQHHWPKIGDELIALLRAHKKPRRSMMVTPIRFKPREQLAKYLRHDRKRRYLAAEKYPTLSEHCTGVDLRWHPGHGVSLPASSMNARYGRTDFTAIDRTIRAKLDNLATYRAKVPGLQIWLLYYAEGNTPTGRLIGKDACDRVVEHLRTMLAPQHPNFDAVWWANETSAAGGPEAFIIV